MSFPQHQCPFSRVAHNVNVKYFSKSFVALGFVANNFPKLFFLIDLEFRCFSLLPNSKNWLLGNISNGFKLISVSQL